MARMRARIRLCQKVMTKRAEGFLKLESYYVMVSYFENDSQVHDSYFENDVVFPVFFW